MTESSIIPLNAKQHAHLTYAPVTDFSFTKNQNSVPLLNFEIVRAARCFPIVFPDAKSPTAYAVLGLGSTNCYVDDKGNWTASYLPLMIANHPFSLIQAHFTQATDDKEYELGLGIEEDAPHFHQKKGKLLFTDRGTETPVLYTIKKSLAEQYKRHVMYAPVLRALVEQDVLEERTVAVEQGRKTKNVGGLRCASKEKVLTLDDVTLASWVRSGLMEMLFAHWQSLRHLGFLLDHAKTQK